MKRGEEGGERLASWNETKASEKRRVEGRVGKKTYLSIPLVLHKLPLILSSHLHERVDDLSRSGGDTREVDGSRVSGEFRGGNGGTEDDVFDDLQTNDELDFGEK